MQFEHVNVFFYLHNVQKCVTKSDTNISGHCLAPTGRICKLQHNNVQTLVAPQDSEKKTAQAHIKIINFQIQTISHVELQMKIITVMV